MRPWNNRGAEARTCISNSEASVYIFLRKEQRATDIKVPVRLRSLIFLLPHLLLSGVLQLIVHSWSEWANRQLTDSLTSCLMSDALNSGVEIAEGCVSTYSLK